MLPDDAVPQKAPGRGCHGLFDQRHPACSVQSLQEIYIFHDRHLLKTSQLFEDRPSYENSLITIMEETEPEVGEKSDQSQENFLTVKFQ